MSHGFFITYSEVFESFVEKLSKREQQLLLYMIKNRDTKTNCMSFKKTSLDELHLKKQNFLKYKSNLIKYSFIVETNIKGQYIINPRFCYSKNSKQFDICKINFAEFKAQK